MSFQAAILRVVIRLLVAAAIYALAMRGLRGADPTPPTAVTYVPAAGLLRPLIIERATSSELVAPTAKQPDVVSAWTFA